MASGTDKNNLSAKHSQQTSKVKFDLDGSHHTDDANESLDEVDEFLEFSGISNNPSSSTDSITNSATLYTKTLTNNDNKSTVKRYSR
jgi:hypothetical protein